MTMKTRCLYVVAIFVALLFAAAPARAQFQPRPLNDPATGESYHIEGGASLWWPTATMFFSSENLGQTPTNIDFKHELGLQDQHFPSGRLVLTASAGKKVVV